MLPVIVRQTLYKRYWTSAHSWDQTLNYNASSVLAIMCISVSIHEGNSFRQRENNHPFFLLRVLSFNVFFFFCSVQHKQPTTILYTATPVTHSLHKALHYFQKRTQHKKRDTGQPFVKKWRPFFLHTTQIVHSTQRGITAYQHHKK